MLIYLFPTLLCLFGIYQFDYVNAKKGKLECYYILAAYLVVIAGLSYKVGSDSSFYMETYDNIPSLGKLRLVDFSETTYQPLYFLLCALCKSVTSNIWLLHLVQSAIVCFVFFSFIRNNTRYLFTGAFMFMTCVYTYFCYEIYKESLAVCMMLWGYKYLTQKKYLVYYLFAIASIMFHFSGIMAFIIPFLRYIKFNKVFFIWVGILLFIVTGFQTYVSYLGLNDTLLQKLDYFLYVATEKYNTNWFIMAFIRNVFVPLCVVILIKIIYKRIPIEWSFSAYILLGIGTLQLAIIFERPMNYLLPFLVLSISEVFGETYHKVRFKFLSMFVACFVFWFACRGWFYARNETWRLMIPYESIFDPKEDKGREKVRMLVH